MAGWTMALADAGRPAGTVVVVMNRLMITEVIINTHFVLQPSILASTFA
jgi:hypothetical protein